MGILNIKHAFLLPYHFRIFGWVIILFGFLLPTTINNIPLLLLASAGCILVGILFVTSRYGLKIDLDQKKYKEYVKVLGFSSGSWISYEAIEKIFINAVKSSQTMASRGNYRTEIVINEFAAYLKFADGSRIELDEDEDKAALITRLNRYNQLLQTSISDNT